MNVILATGNAHKWEEFVEILHQSGYKLNLMNAASAGGMPEVEENGETLEENARIKGDALLERVPADVCVLSDDTGLFVDALDGAPGVHSARFAGAGGVAAANNMKLLHEMHGLPMEKRTARFVCTLYFVQSGSPGHLFTGTCEGHILNYPSGEEGFGYDPLFQPEGQSQTFADLGGELKNRISHRGRAVASWIEFLRSQQS